MCKPGDGRPSTSSGANYAAEKYNIHVYGKYSDPLFQRYRVAAQFLADDRLNVTATVEGYFETQYEQQLRYAVNKYGGSFKQSRPSSPLIFAETEDSILYFMNEERFMSWANKRFKYEDSTRLIFYKRIGNKAFKAVREKSGRSYCALGFAVGSEPKEVVHLELFDEDVPKMARNFIDLLQSPRFDGHPVHRVKAGAWVQAGDLVDGSGAHSEAAGGGFLKHESFQTLHDRAGLLGMASQGKDMNGSQFYITLRELPFLDGKSVIIGRVVSGMRALLKVSKMATKNERPTQNIRITVEREHTILGQLQDKASD